MGIHVIVVGNGTRVIGPFATLDEALGWASGQTQAELDDWAAVSLEAAS